jgi:hypothetical protein
MGHIGATL